MEHPGFFQKVGPFPLTDICEKLGIDQASAPLNTPDLMLDGVQSLSTAGPSQITFFNDRKWLKDFEASKAGLCITSDKFRSKVPDHLNVIYVDHPQKTFIKAIQAFYPESQRTQTSRSTGAMIHETAVIADGVEIEPGVVIGKEAHIGKGTRLSAGSVIGYRTYIGENCMIGPNSVLTHAIIGNNVTIHAGASIGQDGFGYIMGAGGHVKVPQIGRVIIQDMVEIGANSTIDRGALTDTIIGEGTKIDNLVQIAHNVVIGCHAVIVSQTGISGSTKLGNYVVMGGQTGTVGHIEIGDGAQIAASSDVHKSVPAGARYGGTPAKPMKQWFKEIIAVEKMVATRDAKLKKAK